MAVAVAQPSLAGKRVVVIKDQAPLAASGKEVAKADECSVFTVDKVDGEWLWIKSERAYLRRGDVVPFEDAIGQLEAHVRALEKHPAQRYEPDVCVEPLELLRRGGVELV